MKLARDTWLIFQRQLILSIHRPMFLLFSLVQPITYLVIFAPFLLPGLTALGGGQRTIPAPIRPMCRACSWRRLFGGLFAGFGLLADLRNGVIERCRVTPVSRVALLLGRALRDVVVMLIQAAIVTILALPFGLRVALVELVLAYVFLALIGLLTTAISYDMTLLIRDEQTLGQIINAVSQPLGLLAGVLILLALGAGLDPVGRLLESVRLGHLRHAGAVRRPPRRPGGLAGAGHRVRAGHRLRRLVRPPVHPFRAIAPRLTAEETTMTTGSLQARLAADPDLGAGNVLPKLREHGVGPDEPAVTFDVEVDGHPAWIPLTLGQLEQRVAARAAWLHERGIGRRDPVAVYVTSSADCSSTTWR